MLDVSFTGVATQYLVDMPSGTTWSCYEQNLDVEPVDLRPGDEVWLTWNPGHAFGVARRTTLAGADAVSAAGRTSPATADAPRRRHPPPEATKRSWTPYLLLLPGALWLVVFFVLPLVQLARGQLQSRYPASPATTTATQLRELRQALTDYAPHFGRSFVYAGLATVLALRPGLPAGLRHGLQGRHAGATS